jgi:hypothetical protein
MYAASVAKRIVPVIRQVLIRPQKSVVLPYLKEDEAYEHCLRGLFVIELLEMFATAPLKLNICS